MKKPQKIFMAVLVLTLIIPSFAFASWYNPFSWNWTALFNTPTHTETQSSSAATNTINNLASTTPTTKTAKTQNVQKEIPATPPIPTPTQKSNTQPAPILPPQIPTTSNVQKNGYQVCADSNATWDGSSHTSSGGFSCSCKTGYTSSSDGKSCVALPAKTGYQVCSEEYSNGTWDGSSYTSSGGFSCSCKTGYVLSSDGKSCQLSQQETQAQNLLNSPECQSATTALNDVKAQIKPIQDQKNSSYDNYLTTGDTSSFLSQKSSDLDYKLTSLMLRESGLLSKYYYACYGYVAAPQKTYNTNCYNNGGGVSCYTQ